MSEYDRLGRLAKELREKYPPGTRLELISMKEEFSPVEEGTRGTVHFIDDIGQIHMLWDNKRTLPINTDTDKFRMLTPEECYEEKCQEKAERFYAALNKDILPKVDWRALGYSCEKRDGDYSKDILQQMHNAFAECYESTELSGDMGFVAVPAVVLGKDNQMCLALVDLDTCSSGEHWGTTFFTPYGVYQEEAECHPLAREFARAMIPYNYWYTVDFPEDIHVSLNNCHQDIKSMIEEVNEECIGQNGGIKY
jgi:hypothetical protein